MSVRVETFEGDVRRIVVVLDDRYVVGPQPAQQGADVVGVRQPEPEVQERSRFLDGVDCVQGEVEAVGVPDDKGAVIRDVAAVA
ncbi:hypothetical protein O7626_24595 [Micromonospora sp. WMMD1102]|uniref:hypothetical protein n=1 Tax=Micromonospora sp. WMMD1102 TaxID=3016105 RepID=UPI002414D82B|nr:hypothetical protein [Micromonospora sp. WMMD1102]MDG4789071.1 hypothetical protein [Micromonospora sp. WMMD1102]